MATSGQPTFTVTRNDILRQAALQVNAIGATEAMPAAMSADFAFNLNALVKNWQAKGINIHTVAEATLFPAVGQYVYRAGVAATDHITETFYQTETTADTLLGIGVIPVASTTNVTIGDFLGIVLDDGTLHWTTVSSKTATTITFPLVLTDSVDTGQAVFTYTTKIPRPLRVVAARRFEISSARETPIDVTARLDFRALPTKRDAGTVVNLFYDAQLTLGQFNVWRVPSATTDLINFTFYRPIQRFETGADNPDLPDEWTLPLIYSLAEIMMLQYPVDMKRQAQISRDAARYLDNVAAANREGESLFVQPYR